VLGGSEKERAVHRECHSPPYLVGDRDVAVGVSALGVARGSEEE
jgi:hypothetical protein